MELINAILRLCARDNCFKVRKLTIAIQFGIDTSERRRSEVQLSEIFQRYIWFISENSYNISESLAYVNVNR